MKKEQYLYIDFETRSHCDLKKTGAWVYSLHPTTEVIVIGYKFSTDRSNKVKFWQPVNSKGIKQKIPDEIKRYKGLVVAHNYKFEFAIIVNVLCPARLLPAHYKNLKRFVCTMALAYRAQLPGKLDTVARFLNLKHLKLSDQGNKLTNKFSKPRIDRKTGTKYFIEPTKEKNAAWLAYNAGDVLAMQELHRTVKNWNDLQIEKDLYELDKTMNNFGLQVNIKLLNTLSKSYVYYVTVATKQATKLCGVETSETLTIKSPNFKYWINDRIPKWLGVLNVQQHTLNNLQKSLKSMDKHTKNVKNVLKALQLRRILSASAPKKIEKLKNSIDSLGVTRDYIQYCGSHTGRWAGRGFQPHNLPRECTKDEKEYKEIELAVRTKKVKLFEAIEKINSLIRPLIIPRKGCKFLTGDFSAIEARLTFWISKCTKGLQQYKENRDIYKEMASNVFGVSEKNINLKQRLVGKMAILGLGYGMGAKRFENMAKENGIEVNLIFAERVVQTYRTKYKEIPATWQKLEKIFYTCLDRPEVGQSYAGCEFRYSKKANALRVTLPGGRFLYFWGLRNTVEGLQRFHPLKKVEKIWGGVILENIVQAIARNVLAEALLKSVKIGRPVLTVHDEIILEIPTLKARKALKKFEKIMTATPDWVKGLPLGAECKIVKRYGK